MQGIRKYFPLFLLFIHTFSGLAAQDDPQSADLITDRPDQTESSISIPHRAFQIETGFSGELAPNGPGEVRNYTYSGTLLRYGLFEGMELRLALDYSQAKYTFPYLPGPIIEKGLSPLALGTKINLTEQNGWLPEMAIIMHVAFPVFDSDFAIDYAVPDIILAAAHTINPKLSLGYNLGVEWTDADAAPIKKYSLVAGFSLAERIGLFVETFGSFGDGDFINMIDGGLTYLILPNLQYDISGGLGTTAVSPVFFIGTGLSYRLPQ